MAQLTLAKAQEILKKHVTEPHLFTHALAVSAAMGAMGEHFGEDVEYYKAIGYLHDVEFEKYEISLALENGAANYHDQRSDVC